VDLFPEDSGDESLNITFDPEVNQPLSLQGRTKLQNTMEKSAMDGCTTTVLSENVKLESLRKHFNKDLLKAQIYINSIQNKFEELTTTIKTIGAHLMLISETKIDSSYPNAQFSIPGYSLYRNDRKWQWQWRHYDFSIILTYEEKT